MIEKIKNFPMMLYVAYLNFVEDMKDDERGLSDMVVTILLVLVAVLAVVMIWGWMSGWLSDLWSQISGEAAKIK